MANQFALTAALVNGLQQGIAQARREQQAAELQKLLLLSKSPGYELQPAAPGEVQPAHWLGKLFGQDFRPSATGAPVVGVGGTPFVARQAPSLADSPLGKALALAMGAAGSQAAPAVGGVAPGAGLAPAQPGGLPVPGTQVASAQAGAPVVSAAPVQPPGVPQQTQPTTRPQSAPQPAPRPATGGTLQDAYAADPVLSAMLRKRGGTEFELAQRMEQVKTAWEAQQQDAAKSAREEQREQRGLDKDYSTRVAQLLDDARQSNAPKAVQAQISSLIRQTPRGDFARLDAIDSLIVKQADLLGKFRQQVVERLAVKLGGNVEGLDVDDPNVQRALQDATREVDAMAQRLAASQGVNAAMAMQLFKEAQPIAMGYPEIGKRLFDLQTGERVQPLQVSAAEARQYANRYVDVGDEKIAQGLDQLNTNAIPFLNQVSAAVSDIYGPGGFLDNLEASGIFAAKGKGALVKALQTLPTKNTTPEQQAAITKFQAYERFVAGNLPRLKSTVGDSGVLTNQDIINLNRLLPDVGLKGFKLPDNKDLAFALMNNLMDLVESTKRRAFHTPKYTDTSLRRPGMPAQLGGTTDFSTMSDDEFEAELHKALGPK